MTNFSPSALVPFAQTKGARTPALPRRPFLDSRGQRNGSVLSPFFFLPHASSLSLSLSLPYSSAFPLLYSSPVDYRTRSSAPPPPPFSSSALASPSPPTLTARAGPPVFSSRLFSTLPYSKSPAVSSQLPYSLANGRSARPTKQPQLTGTLLL
jgi:hypothetical protein